jgi:hypothetical protein
MMSAMLPTAARKRTSWDVSVGPCADLLCIASAAFTSPRNLPRLGSSVTAIREPSSQP